MSKKRIDRLMSEWEETVKTYLARWLLPINEQPIEDAFVRIENGIIKDHGRRGESASFLDGEITDLGESVVMPGLVNAHTHLELSALRDKMGETTDFVDWVSRLVARRYTLRKGTLSKAAAKGIDEAIASGTVALADVTNTGITVPLLKSKSLYARVFHELYGLNDQKAESMYAKKKKQIERYPYEPKISHHIVPHAPYSVSPMLFKTIRDSEKMISVHLAESKDEVEFITDGGGRMKGFMKYLKRNWEATGLTPVKYLDTLGVLGENTIAVHVVWLSDEDIGILKERRVNVCLCARSNQKMGVGRAPAKQLLDSGINITLGTDSLASNSDLSLLNEMRAFSKIYPEIERKDIVRMATMGGAVALELDARLGSIEVGKEGKLISIKTRGSRMSDPYDSVFTSENPLVTQLGV